MPTNPSISIEEKQARKRLAITLHNEGYHQLSHGTMQPRDTLPALMACLRELDKVRAVTLAIAHPEVFTPKGDFIPGAENANDGEAWVEAYVELEEALGEHAPEGFYVGTHPGDGSALGFWQSDGE